VRGREVGCEVEGKGKKPDFFGEKKDVESVENSNGFVLYTHFNKNDHFALFTLFFKLNIRLNVLKVLSGKFHSQ
jgi:hypothetical protein